MIYCNWPVKSGKLSGTGGAANAVPVPDQHRTTEGFKMSANHANTPFQGVNATPLGAGLRG